MVIAVDLVIVDLVLVEQVSPTSESEDIAKLVGNPPAKGSTHYRKASDLSGKYSVYLTSIAIYFYS